MQATYTVHLTTNSPKYSPDYSQTNYYYEAIEVNVADDGMYTLRSDTEMSVSNTLYQNKFNPFNPSVNVIGSGTTMGCIYGFSMIYYYEKQKIYIVVTTTNYPNETGSFSIFALGPNNITLKHSGKYLG
jgi:hypothetical protein